MIDDIRQSRPRASPQPRRSQPRLVLSEVEGSTCSAPKGSRLNQPGWVAPLLLFALFGPPPSLYRRSCTLSPGPATSSFQYLFRDKLRARKALPELRTRLYAQAFEKESESARSFLEKYPTSASAEMEPENATFVPAT